MRQQPRPRPSRRVLFVALSLAVVGIVDARADSQAAASRSTPLVVDHRAVAEFDRLSDGELQAAARLRLMVRGASISFTIDYALNCLMNSFTDFQRRPHACDRQIPAREVVYGAKYDRRNWKIELRGNPGWYAKVTDFVERVDGLTSADPFDVVSFNFNYADGIPESDILPNFFLTNPKARLGNVATLEALEKRHPDLVFVWWSMALPRRSLESMLEFNRRIRAYTRAHNKVLFDVADIESHAPDGSPCADNQGNGLEALCEGYTGERNAGHLVARGGQRVAKAIWVLMARLAARAG